MADALSRRLLVLRRRWRHIWSSLAVSVSVALTVAISLNAHLHAASRAATRRAQIHESPDTARPLEPGKSVERELEAGHTDVYSFALEQGQYLEVMAEQQGTDVSLTLRGPDGRVVFVLDAMSATHGTEPLHWVADASGRYRLEVRGVVNEVQPHRYVIRVLAIG